MTTEPTMTDAPDPSAADGLRAGLRAMWSAVAPGWRRHADHVEEHGAAVTAAMLASCAPQPGERLLELACGPGAVGLAAAPLLAPGGEVVLSDVAPEMTAIAADRAAALGLDVRTRVLDLERIDEPDGSYDVVVCRHGLMLVVDPVSAAAEARRILRPGGRVVFAVWGPRARNPWLGALFDGVSAHTPAPLPPPGIPHPFSLDDPAQLAAVLADAGWSDATVTELPMVQHAASFAGWWERCTALAGPLANLLANLPSETVTAMQDSARELLEPYAQADGAYAIPGITLLGSATRD